MPDGSENTIRYRIMRGLAFAAALLLLAMSSTAAAVIIIGLILSAPATIPVGPAPPDLRAETVTIPSTSGATLRGWFLSGRPGGGAIVLMHGVHSNRLSMVRRARLLHDAGFSVLLFDFQAHGESTGTRITFGHLEAKDAGSAIGYVRQRLPRERIGAIGTSLGGAAALLDRRPIPVDALVLESVYSDIKPAVANRIRSVLGTRLGGIAAPPLEFAFELLLPPILGVTADDLRPIDHIADVAAPVLISSGTRDERTTMAETTAMFDRARSPKLLWAVAGAKHVDLEAYAPAEYRQRVLPFLVGNLQR